MPGVSMGMGAQAQSGAKVEAGVAAKASVKALLAEASGIVRMDCLMQAAAVAKLVEAGVLVDDCFLDVGECDAVEAESEEEFDSECEYVDDDEMPALDDLDGWASSLDTLGEGVSSPFMSNAYTMVVDGIRCIAPDEPFASIHASSRKGRTILACLHEQFEFYRSVAKWLEEEGLLSGVEEFRKGHVTKTRKDFCTDAGFDATRATYYIRNCALVLPDGTIPLESAFK